MKLIPMKQPLQHATAQNPRRSQGFTLVEMLVALLILGLLLSVVLTAIASNTSLNSQTELRSQAAVAAQRLLDEQRNQSAWKASGSDPAVDVAVGGHTFQVTLSYCTNPSYCTDTARQIVSQASYNNKVLFSVETVFTSINSTANATN